MKLSVCGKSVGDQDVGTESCGKAVELEGDGQEVECILEMQLKWLAGGGRESFFRVL